MELASIILHPKEISLGGIILQPLILMMALGLIIIIIKSQHKICPPFTHLPCPLSGRLQIYTHPLMSPILHQHLSCKPLIPCMVKLGTCFSKYSSSQNIPPLWAVCLLKIECLWLYAIEMVGSFLVISDPSFPCFSFLCLVVAFLGCSAQPTSLALAWTCRPWEKQPLFHPDYTSHATHGQWLIHPLQWSVLSRFKMAETIIQLRKKFCKHGFKML